MGKIKKWTLKFGDQKFVELEREEERHQLWLECCDVENPQRLYNLDDIRDVLVYLGEMIASENYDGWTREDANACFEQLGEVYLFFKCHRRDHVFYIQRIIIDIEHMLIYPGDNRVNMDIPLSDNFKGKLYEIHNVHATDTLFQWVIDFIKPSTVKQWWASNIARIYAVPEDKVIPKESLPQNIERLESLFYRTHEFEDMKMW